MAKINVSQFAILADMVPLSGLSYTVELGFKGAVDNKRIGCDFSVEFAHNDKAILKLGVFCEFDINPDDWNERMKDKKVIFTKDELGFFANQTVGIARGILFCKTEGTPFSVFILPPINLVSLIKDDFVVDTAQ